MLSVLPGALSPRSQHKVGFPFFIMPHSDAFLVDKGWCRGTYTRCLFSQNAKIDCMGWDSLTAVALATHHGSPNAIRVFGRAGGPERLSA